VLQDPRPRCLFATPPGRLSASHRPVRPNGPEKSLFRTIQRPLKPPDSLMSVPRAYEFMPSNPEPTWCQRFRPRQSAVVS